MAGHHSAGHRQDIQYCTAYSQHCLVLTQYCLVLRFSVFWLRSKCNICSQICCLLPVVAGGPGVWRNSSVKAIRPQAATGYLSKEDFPRISERCPPPNTTLYWLVLTSTAEYYILLSSTSQYDLVQPSTTYCYLVLSSTTQYDLVQPSTTYIRLVLASTAQYYLILPNNIQHRLVLPSISQYYLLLLSTI